MNFDSIKQRIAMFFTRINGKTTLSKNFNGDVDYVANFASCGRRFGAFLVDIFVIYSIMSVLIFSIIKKDIDQEMSKFDKKEFVEVSFDVDSSGNISNIDNTEVVKGGEKNKNTISIKSDDDKKEELKKVVITKIYSNKFCRAIMLFFPLLYHILYLMGRKRATLGQQIFNLVVVKMDGNDLRFGDILSRVFSFSICCGVLFLIPITIIIPLLINKKFTMYDYFTDTCVIELNKKNE